MADNKEGVAEVRDDTHRKEISKLAGPQERIIILVFPAEWVVTDKMIRFGYRISHLGHERFELAERVFAVVAVIQVVAPALIF